MFLFVMSDTVNSIRIFVFDFEWSDKCTDFTMIEKTGICMQNWFLRKSILDNGVTLK